MAKHWTLSMKIMLVDWLNSNLKRSCDHNLGASWTENMLEQFSPSVSTLLPPNRHPTPHPPKKKTNCLCPDLSETSFVLDWIIGYLNSRNFPDFLEYINNIFDSDSLHIKHGTPITHQLSNLYLYFIYTTLNMAHLELINDQISLFF